MRLLMFWVACRCRTWINANNHFIYVRTRAYLRYIAVVELHKKILQFLWSHPPRIFIPLKYAITPTLGWRRPFHPVIQRTIIILITLRDSDRLLPVCRCNCGFHTPKLWIWCTLWCNILTPSSSISGSHVCAQPYDCTQTPRIYTKLKILLGWCFLPLICWSSCEIIGWNHYVDEVPALLWCHVISWPTPPKCTNTANYIRLWANKKEPIHWFGAELFSFDQNINILTDVMQLVAFMNMCFDAKWRISVLRGMEFYTECSSLI